MGIDMRGSQAAQPILILGNVFILQPCQLGKFSRRSLSILAPLTFFRPKITDLPQAPSALFKTYVESYVSFL
jgi:hypothetical protein